VLRPAGGAVVELQPDDVGLRKRREVALRGRAADADVLGHLDGRQSYATEKRLSKHPDEFGKGAIEGVAGPEAANNASFSGTLVPLLTLGLPTSATAAIMLAAFQIFNLQPGPQLFTNNSELVWTLIASLYIGNVMLLLLNLPMIRIWVKVLVMYGIGVVGFCMRRYEFPIAPVILGVILGPVMEVQFRRALIASGGDATVFVDRPLTVALLSAALLALILPYAPSIIGRLRGRARPAGRLAFGEGD
jgi:putative tricarboxylic transport membrane protein